MDKQNMGYTYDGILVSLRKDTWMNLEDIVLSEKSQPHKDNYYMSPFM